MRQAKRITTARVETGGHVYAGVYYLGRVRSREEGRALARAIRAVLEATGGLPAGAGAARRSPAAAALRVLLDERRVLQDETLDGRGRLVRLPISGERLAPIVQRAIARFT